MKTVASAEAEAMAVRKYNKVLGGELRICKIDKILRGIKIAILHQKGWINDFFDIFSTNYQGKSIFETSIQLVC